MSSPGSLLPFATLIAPSGICLGQAADARECVRAVEESRPAGHQRVEGEIALDQVYHGRIKGPKKQGKASAPAAAQDEDDLYDDDSGADAGAYDGGSSDPSFSSGDLAPGKRKRGRRHSSDEEGGGGSGSEDSVAAAARRRRRRRQGSDDERPLGQRITELQGGQAKRPRAAAAARKFPRPAAPQSSSDDDGERLLAQAQAQRRPSGGGRGRGGVEMDKEVRHKVKNAFQQGLELAACEIAADAAGGGGGGGAVPSPAEVAADVEDALMRLYGEHTRSPTARNALPTSRCATAAACCCRVCRRCTCFAQAAI